MTASPRPPGVYRQTWRQLTTFPQGTPSPDFASGYHWLGAGWEDRDAHGQASGRDSAGYEGSLGSSHCASLSNEGSPPIPGPGSLVELKGTNIFLVGPCSKVPSSRENSTNPFPTWTLRTEFASSVLWDYEVITKLIAPMKALWSTLSRTINVTLNQRPL
jgi:hypothetical protein